MSAPRKPHADSDRDGKREHGWESRGRRAQEPEASDRRQRPGHGPRRAESRGDGRSQQRPDAQAEDGDRSEEPADGVREAEVLLDLRQQRSDADELGPERERCEEERPQDGDSSACHSTVT
jgi:hypothetical protein